MNILAIDIGGSKINAGIVDLNGNVLCAEKEQLPAGTTADSLLAAIKDKCDKIAGKYDFDRIGIKAFSYIGALIVFFLLISHGFYIFDAKIRKTNQWGERHAKILEPKTEDSLSDADAADAD